MGTDAVIYLEDGIGDEALRVLDEYAPEVIFKNLSGLGEIASVHAAVPAVTRQMTAPAPSPNLRQGPKAVARSLVGWSAPSAMTPVTTPG